MRRRWTITALSAVLLAGLGLQAGPANATQVSVAPVNPGSAWPIPSSPAPDNNLAVLGAGETAPGSAGVASSAAAAARARASGKPTVISALTTPTTTVTALPNGLKTVQEYVLPVRVRQGQTWVAVDTSLRAEPGGRLSPVAVPGDAISFSVGGTGPLASISAQGATLSLSWPTSLPSPIVSGSSATYRNLLPGIDLVLTATSGVSGGFSEVLVVHSAVASRNPALASLNFRVSGKGVRLGSDPVGGLTADLANGSGSFAAGPPRMWDSSALAPGSSQGRPAEAAARTVGAELAPWGTAPVSSVSGPDGGARDAAVGARVSPDGATLSLSPDAAMLASPSTRFPVFIDPSFNFLTSTGSKQAYDPVQSGSGCTGSHYNSSSYPYSPVGYDNFQQGTCQYTDTDYALYRVTVPSVLASQPAHLIDASFNLTEVYTSDCVSSPTVTVSWIGAIGSGTGWPGPGIMSGNVNASATWGPDSGSCNSVVDVAKTVSKGFNVTANIGKVIGATNMTFRVWEQSNTNEAEHKQLTDNPNLQVTYNDTPDTPLNLEVNGTSGTTGAIKCDTNPADPNLPRLGKSDSTSGPFLLASYNDKDGDSVQGVVKYWNDASSGTKFSAPLTASSTAANQTLPTQIPASFTSGLADGTVVGWQAQAEDGKGTSGSTTYGPYTSAAAGPCYFAVYPTAPDPPSVTAGFSTSVNQPVGSAVTFTIANATTGSTAAEFVWNLDATPPTTGTVPAGETCTTSATTTPDCVLTPNSSGGAATLTITVPAPGPHDLWVYELDSAGNESQIADVQFSGAGDPAVAYTSGSSLSANFGAALTAGQSFDNTMISTQAGQSGSANGDGGGASFDKQELASMGWTPRGSVTVDGASFTLPAFGAATSGPDNLLAANQTIGTGPSGAQASSIVFLATSTDGFVRVAGLATGSVDSGVLASDPTVPAVGGGIGVTGTDCSGMFAFNTTLSGCIPASGSINYAAGCPAGGSSPYTLTVPDWISGPADLAAQITASRDRSGTSQQADNPKIFAFAVPVDGSCTVDSITLPDVGVTVNAQITSGSTGVSQTEPGLHILGVALRNTTTSTPVQPTAASPVSTPCPAGCPAPAGQAWTGAFAAPTEDAFGPPSGVTWGDQTIRISLSPNVSAPAGTEDVRIRLSDPGFLSGDGTGPLVIGAATIASASSGAVPAQAPVALTFGGGASVTIPKGGDVYSDPIALPFAITAGKPLLASLWVENTSLPYLPENTWPSGAQSWFNAANSATPNQTGDTTGTPFSGSPVTAVPILTGLDLTTPEVTTAAGEASPGEPTAVIAGNNVIDGAGSAALSDAASAPSQRLAGQITSQLLGAGYGVVDAGVQSNQILTDGTGAGGVSLLARLDRDVLAEPDVGTVVIDEGLEDLLRQGNSASVATDLAYAYGILQEQLSAFGVGDITVGTLTPCSGYANPVVADSCSATVDANRVQVNTAYINGIAGPGCAADLDATVSNGATPEKLASPYGTSDWANLTFAGYAALAPVVAGPAGNCPFAPPNDPLPPVP